MPGRHFMKGSVHSDLICSSCIENNNFNLKKQYLLGVAAMFLAVSIQAQQPTLSQVGTSGTPVGINKVTAGGVLWNQTTKLSTNGYTSQNFETANDAFDNQLADDFSVPTGQTWTIDSLFVPGQYSAAGGPCDTALVYIYTDAAGTPGTQVYFASVLNVDTDTNGTFTIKLPTSAVLTSGTYWLSVVARMDFTPKGQWYWNADSLGALSSSMWRNPGNGFSTGATNWTLSSTALSATVINQAFMIYGCDGVTTAGLDSANAICETETAYDLSGLLSGATSGGTYLDLDGTSALAGSDFDASAAGPGIYTFGYKVGTSICADTAFFTVTVQTAPVAGVGDTINACNTATAVNLWTGLTGHNLNTGTFIDLSASGLLNDSLFNASSALSTLYEFLYVLNGAPSCANDTAHIWINVTPCTGLNHDIMEQVSLYPNPVKDIFSIETPSAFGLRNVRISGIQGNVISSLNISGTSQEMDLRSLPAGMYLIELSGEAGSLVRRISVE